MHSNQRDLLRPVDMLVASSLLASGSLLLFISSLALIPPIQDLRVLVLAWPAIFLQFLGWGALAGLIIEPEGGRPEDSTRLRRRALIFVANLGAFFIGLGLLIIVYPTTITMMPSLGLIFGAFLFPFVPVVYAPVVFVHAGVFWWNSGELLTDQRRVLVRAASLVLVTIAGIGLVLQLVSPENLFNLAPLAGLTAGGYLLAAVGWRATHPRGS